MTTATRRARSNTDQAQTGPATASPDAINATAHTKALPDCETLLVGALLDAGAATVTKVLQWVEDTDLADPFQRAILAAIREAAAAGEAGVPAVNSRLLQAGIYGTEHGKPIQRRLVDAATSGAVGLAAMSYAADVVEQAQLRGLTGLCEVGEAATGLATRDRTTYLLGYVTRLNKLTSRLLELRKRSGGTDHA
jgi:hypothetical protein